MTIAKTFERFSWVLWVVGAAGCSTSPGTSGETHFQCSATPDCLKHGADLVCVEGTCAPESDEVPAGGPPRAAANISVSPGSGSCNATHGLLAIPLDQRVYDALNCDLTTGCSPNEFVVVDGDVDAQVTCNVSAAGEDDYSINARVVYQGSELSVSGVIKSDGGLVEMTHYFPDRGVALRGTCSLAIADKQLGAVAPGGVWALFVCPEFADPNAAGGMDCSAEGAFLFDRCEL